MDSFFDQADNSATPTAPFPDERDLLTHDPVLMLLNMLMEMRDALSYSAAHRLMLEYQLAIARGHSAIGARAPYLKSRELCNRADRLTKSISRTYTRPHAYRESKETF